MGKKKDRPAAGGHKKIKNLILYIFDKDDFRAFVAKTRTELDIPEQGFTAGAEYPYPPKEWRYKDNRQIRQKLEKKIQRICRHYLLHHLEGSEAITTFILYNRAETPSRPDTYELLVVSDIVEEKKHPFVQATQNDDDYLYPIALRISPDASKEDIVEYVNRVYGPHILRLQKKYRRPRSKITKLRTRKESSRQLNEFIYQNRDLPRKKLMGLVNDKFATKERYFEYSEIAKIISLEKSRRK